MQQFVTGSKGNTNHQVGKHEQNTFTQKIVWQITI